MNPPPPVCRKPGDLEGRGWLKQPPLIGLKDAKSGTTLIATCPGIGGRSERLFRRLREASSLEAAEEAYGGLDRFVKGQSAEGLKSLQSAREEMLTLFRLDVPDTFNKPLLSTNSIENSIRNMRRLLGRVTRWRAETNMASRWMTCAMLEAEKGFQRIQGYRQTQLLIDALNRESSNEEQEEKDPLRKKKAA